MLKVAESRSPQAGGPDWIGFVLFTVALASLVYGLIESNEKSFGNGAGARLLRRGRACC